MFCFVGGFSMGGAMAMTLAYKYHHDVAGVFALSSFLNHNSSAYQTLKQTTDKEKLPPLFQCHGERDELSSIEWAKETHKNLTDLGVKGEFHSFNMFHEFNKRELTMWRQWVLKLLPGKDIMILVFRFNKYDCANCS
ncbi:hypothetical protein KUTeg_013348 [Tegillarca granosa]|uniref:palmitoyl-protein hydrolase n=1 Tax=Tegillarca granosa TaxID=220873 RepID=A0ABQ9ETT2_TEGGR|nr:hypothetical protein KUTeg_013348 [Tegillarca granosa]